MTVTASWKALGVKGTALRDLYSGKTAKAPNGVNVSLAAHGSVIYRVD